MGSKKHTKQKSVSRKVDWIHRPDPEAEHEFWRLYFALSLELLVQESPEAGKGPGS